MERLGFVGFDLDGTAVHPITRKISERNQVAFMAAHNQGAAVCIVSGRPIQMIEREWIEAPWCDWVISSNGAMVRSAKGGEVLNLISMKKALAQQVIDVVAEFNPALYLTFWDDAYKDSQVIPYLRARDDMAQDWDKSQLETSLAAFKTIPSIPEKLATSDSDPLKFNILFPTRGIADIAEQRIAALGGLEIGRMIDNSEIEVTATGVDKGDAVDLLLGHLGVDPAHAVCFGDGGNDLPMAGHAFSFVAMDNATDEIKAAADEVCGHVDDDGLGAWIEAQLA